MNNFLIQTLITGDLWNFCEISIIEAKKVLLNIILIRKPHLHYFQNKIYICNYKTSFKFIVAYINCVLKVNANEVFPYHDDDLWYYVFFL